MNCKNCQNELAAKVAYCGTCGAQVIQERITVKHLLTDLYTNAFGWDNKFWVTIRMLITDPGSVFKQYIGGTRKKFANPFSFFAICAAISLIAFNQFSVEFSEMNGAIFANQIEQIAQENTGTTEAQVHTPDWGKKFQESLLPYWNLYSFLFLPIYTIIAFWVFGKPYNFGEHLVINAYIQGITFLLLTITFLLSLLTTPALYYPSQVFMILFYSYAYSRLYQHTGGQVVLKLLKFFGILILFCLGFFAAGIGVAVIMGISGK